MLKFSSDSFQNHLQSEKLCKDINTWIKEDAPQAGSFTISQLKEKLNRARKNPPRTLTKGGSLLGMISKRNATPSKIQKDPQVQG